MFDHVELAEYLISKVNVWMAALWECEWLKHPNSHFYSAECALCEPANWVAWIDLLTGLILTTQYLIILLYMSFDNAVIHYYLDLICLGKGADIDCIDCKGQSPLLMASNCSAWKTVAFLLSIGKAFSWIFNTFYLQYHLHARFCIFNILSYWK